MWYPQRDIWWPDSAQVEMSTLRPARGIMSGACTTPSTQEPGMFGLLGAGCQAWLGNMQKLSAAWVNYRKSHPVQAQSVRRSKQPVLGAALHGYSIDQLRHLLQLGRDYPTKKTPKLCVRRGLPCSSVFSTFRYYNDIRRSMYIGIHLNQNHHIWEPSKNWKINENHLFRSMNACDGP